ncbi:MAG: hypothetical protein ACKPAC_08715, partial [Alphaproteobacteria bacterium]
MAKFAEIYVLIAQSIGKGLNCNSRHVLFQGNQAMPAPERDAVPAPVDPAYARKPQKALLHRIEEMQGDALLLLDHLAKRPERGFSVKSGGEGKSISLLPLMKTPAEIADDSEQFSDLVRLLDELARQASPATPQTILKSRKPFNWADLLLIAAMFLAFVVSIDVLGGGLNSPRILHQFSALIDTQKTCYR